MLRRLIICLVLLSLGILQPGLLRPGPAVAATVVDATGRSVELPEHIARVLPAGPPAAILLSAIAPDLMMGWTSPVSDTARGMLAPQVATLPQVPRVTGRDDVSDKVRALAPDLIVDYGTVAPRYTDLARSTQQRTGIPTILLDGSLEQAPEVFRLLGGVLHREERGETLARFAEAILALPHPTDRHPRVLYARGADGLTVVAPGADVTAIFSHLGWQQVAPPGDGPLRQASIEQIRSLDPDVVLFADPAMGRTLAQSPAWQSLRAVHDGRAFAVPALPFGWLEEPPSINRLLGLAWLSSRDPATSAPLLAPLFNAVVYGRVLTPAQLDGVLAGFAAVAR
jgi:iron complex transport system substrate-binding protein